MKNLKQFFENYIPEFDPKNPHEGYLQFLEVKTESYQEEGLSISAASNLAHKDLEDQIGQLRYAVFNNWLDGGGIGDSNGY